MFYTCFQILFVPILYNIWIRQDEASEILTNSFVASKGIDRLALFCVCRMAFGGKGKIL